MDRHATVSTKVSGHCNPVLKFRTSGFMFEKKGHRVQRNAGDLDHVVGFFVLVGVFSLLFERD